MINSCTCALHLGATNFKFDLQKTNQMAQKIVFFLVVLWNEFCSLQKGECMLYKLIKCIQWTLLNIDVNILYPLKKLKSKFFI